MILSHRLDVVCATVAALLRDRSIIGIDRASDGRIRIVRRKSVEPEHVGFISDESASGIICSISMGMVAPRALKAWTFHFEGVGLDGRFVFARRCARSPLFVTVESAEGRMVTGFRRKGE